jgi:hypothetical protein
MFMNSSTTLTLPPAAGSGRPLGGRPGDGPPLAVDRLPDGTWQLTLHHLEPVSVERLPSAEVHIILAPRDEPLPTDTADVSPAPAGPAPDPIEVDLDARTVSVQGRSICLPRLEFDLLAHLVTHPQRAFTRQQLMASVWPTCRAGDRTVDVHIARLRRRLGPGLRDSISTVFGIGYKYLPVR